MPTRAISSWSCPSVANPARYDSPKMFRHGDELYVVARRDLGGQHDEMIESDPDRSWVQGQTSPDGTQIYLVTLRFERE